ncbi:uncharacterized protein LOC109806643 [Cajanus cajan]|uniref:uncharacterized protein LOC109806643 n=1 Tax=Cajanus cajan TaxID=3821 RepID=UPI0010FB5143|nr:uncharacterized protein LOC109806643 [Cajanus cajan]
MRGSIIVNITFTCSHTYIHLMHKPTHPCGGTHPPPPPHILNDVVFPSRMLSHAAAASWLRRRRIRYLFLLLCSPLLLLLLCAALPFLCAAHLCRKLLRAAQQHADADADLGRCEEGCSDEDKGLLHRYLEDQLLLVRSMYECGDDDQQQEHQEKEDSRTLRDVESGSG